MIFHNICHITIINPIFKNIQHEESNSLKSSSTIVALIVTE